MCCRLHLSVESVSEVTRDMGYISSQPMVRQAHPRTPDCYRPQGLSEVGFISAAVVDSASWRVG